MLNHTTLSQLKLLSNSKVMFNFSSLGIWCMMWAKKNWNIGYLFPQVRAYITSLILNKKHIRKKHQHLTLTDIIRLNTIPLAHTVRADEKKKLKALARRKTREKKTRNISYDFIEEFYLPFDIKVHGTYVQNTLKPLKHIQHIFIRFSHYNLYPFLSQSLFSSHPHTNLAHFSAIFCSISHTQLHILRYIWFVIFHLFHTLSLFPLSLHLPPSSNIQSCI